MKYEDLQKCISIAETTSSLTGIRIADANVSLVSFQSGANGGIKQKLCFDFEYNNADISLQITPKGGAE